MATEDNSQTLYEFKVAKSDGSEQSLAQYQGKIVLVVNVASKCGFTPQYAGLESLYKKFKDRGLVILGFPCNQFGGQEPGSEEEIQSFCQLNYGVSFPILKKIEVNGASTDPLYVWLKATAPGIFGTGAIKWNFTKFLIGPSGQVMGRYAPAENPDNLAKPIEEILAKTPAR